MRADQGGECAAICRVGIGHAMARIHDGAKEKNLFAGSVVAHGGGLCRSIRGKGLGDAWRRWTAMATRRCKGVCATNGDASGWTGGSEGRGKGVGPGQGGGGDGPGGGVRWRGLGADGTHVLVRSVASAAGGLVIDLVLVKRDRLACKVRDYGPATARERTTVLTLGPLVGRDVVNGCLGCRRSHRSGDASPRRSSSSAAW